MVLRQRLLLLAIAAPLAPALVVACTSENPLFVSDAGATPDVTQPVVDAGTRDADRPRPDAARDASDAATDAFDTDACAVGVTVFDAGDTCVGYGTGGSCQSACGLPAYGYVCLGGGPPNVSGCVRAGADSPVFGATYCCSELKCVRSSFQDPECAEAGAPPLYYQCATASDGGPLVAPGGGCVATSGPAPYNYFCCPS
jgi:hypothetical protein